MKKCEKCGEPAEGEVYRWCNPCWKWQDPRYKKTVGDLKELLSKYDDDTPVDLCMDWTELPYGERRKRGLDAQWQDELGGIAYSSKHNKVMILNKHFK